MPRPLWVGLAGRDPAWVSLLESEGLAWAPAGADPAAEVFVLPAETDPDTRRRCLARVRAGATAVCEASVAVGDDLRIDRSIPMPYEKGSFLGLAEAGQAHAVEVLRCTLGRGAVYQLPFWLGRLWGDAGTARRHVNIGQGRTIFEDMAAVVKKNVRRVVVDVLKAAFFERGLPYIHRWYYPGRSRSVLCFRGDADGGPGENLQRWLGVVRGFASCVSLFVCTSRYQAKRDLIAQAAAANIEVGSHNHWHIVFPDRATNAMSLTRAERVLASACYRPRGFVAPAYFWHRSLYRLLEQRGYHYASCFGLCHDSLPYRPVVEGRLGGVPEMPFHCLGDRFRRFDIPLDSPAVRAFFAGLIEKKHAAGEPMLLYGHPDAPGRMGTTPDLVRFILETALSRSDVRPMQLGQYARWWRRRAELNVRPAYLPASEAIVCEGVWPGGGDGVKLRLEVPDGRCFLAEPGQCRPPGKPLSALEAFPPLRLPGPTDMGEVVYTGPDAPPGGLDRRTVRRFAKAYVLAYLGFGQ